MALTIADAHPQHPRLSLGRVAGRAAVITFDSSYPTGGESLTAGALGFSEVFFVLPSPRASGYVVQYNKSTAKLQVYVEEAVAAGGPLVEVADTTNLATLVVDLFVIGV